jgi:hypothetical protein
MTPSHHGQTPHRDVDPVSEREPEDEVDVALAALRRRRHDPPSDLVDRAVLRAVQARATAVERQRASPGRFMKPWGALALFGLTSVGAMLAVHQYISSPPESEASPSAAASSEDSSQLAATNEPVPVRFVLPAAGATQVAVAGEFNDWDASRTLLNDDDGDGVFHTTLSLGRGAYAYMFVVDGERWVTDPFADAYRDDGFGNRNAVLRIP